MEGTPRFLDEPMAPNGVRPAAAGMAEAPPPVIERPVLLEARPGAAAAVGADWNPRDLAVPPVPARSTSYAVAGLGVLAGSWVLLSAYTAVVDAFARSTALGGVTLGLYLTGFSLLLYAVFREWRSLHELHRVDALRAALDSSTAELEPTRRLCGPWLDRLVVRVPDAALAAAGLRESGDLPQLRAVLRSRLAQPLAIATRRIGLKAATEGSALVAVSPHASWDGVIVAWRGLRVIRQVAQLYGLRPGPAVTVALLRRVAQAAVETAATDLMSQTAADHLLGSVPVIRHLAAIPGASVAGIRLYRLAGVVGRACSPM